MNYDPEQLREWSRQIGMHDYNYASPKKADIEEQLDAHADALERIKALEECVREIVNEDAKELGTIGGWFRLMEKARALVGEK